MSENCGYGRNACETDPVKPAYGSPNPAARAAAEVMSALSMYPMSSRNGPGNSRCRLNVQLLIYPGLPAPGFMYSIVPPFASVGSIVGRLAVTAGRPLSRRSAETRPEVTCGKF